MLVYLYKSDSIFGMLRGKIMRGMVSCQPSQSFSSPAQKIAQVWRRHMQVVGMASLCTILREKLYIVEGLVM